MTGIADEVPASVSAPSGAVTTAVQSHHHNRISQAAGPQLVGSPTDRIVLLYNGAVVAWASLASKGMRVHLVAPLRLDGPDLADFRQVVGCDLDTIACVWGGP